MRTRWWRLPKGLAVEGLATDSGRHGGQPGRVPAMTGHATLPLRRAGLDGPEPLGLGRAGATRRGPRLRHAHHARPLHRPAGARAGPHVGRRRHHHVARRQPWCSTTTTGTPSCWPRSSPPSTSCPTVGSRSASARAGCAPTTTPPACPTTRPACGSTASSRGWRCSRASWPTAPLSFAGKHYTVSDLQGMPKPVQRPHPPILIGGGGRRVLSIAAREADIVGINGTMRSGAIDGDTLSSLAADAVDEKLRDRARRGRRPDRPDRAERTGLLRRRHQRPPGHGGVDRRDDGVPARRHPRHPLRPHRHAGPDRRRPAGATRALGLLLRHRRGRRKPTRFAPVVAELSGS